MCKKIFGDKNMVSRAKINPEMMRWAREYAGYTNGYEKTLPKDIKEKIDDWESGKKYPTWNQLRAVSKKYNLPTAFFFMKETPSFEKLPNLINYRKADNPIYARPSPDLIRNIRKSEIRRDIYIDLLGDLNEETSKFEVPNLKRNKTTFADYIRNILDVSLNIQKSWFNDAKHYTHLNNWKDIINEKLGILIFETENVDIKEMRGICIFHDETPIILLNGKDEPNGRIFTLFHELTHLLLGESAICGDDIDREMEIFCNSVAGEFLVPKNDLNNGMYSNNLSESSIRELSNIYGVSEHVILRRLLDIQKITKQDYISKTRRFNEYVPLISSKSRGNYLNNMIKYNSKAYYSIVLEAYDSGMINSLDFAKFTNLGQNQIPKLQERLFG